MRAQCIRILPPISGPIIDATIINGGSGYTNPTVQISTPDSPGGLLLNPNGAQAVGFATQSGGVINNVFIEFGGDGYYQPIIQINDPTGVGAQIEPIIAPIMTANPYQEVYKFSDIPLGNFPGVASVYAVLSYSLLYANGRYSALVYSFTQYQSLIRQYGPGMYYYVPCLAAQHGRGANGSIFMYPPPSQSLQFELDCVCLPEQTCCPITTTIQCQTHWTDAVPFYAAHLAMLELQNGNSARMYDELFDQRMKRYGQYTLPGHAPSPYGRP